MGREQARVVIERVEPQIDSGRFPVKRVMGDLVQVVATIFTDGHDRLAAVLRYRAGTQAWREVPMTPHPDDRWEGRFPVDALVHDARLVPPHRRVPHASLTSSESRDGKTVPPGMSAASWG